VIVRREHLQCVPEGAMVNDWIRGNESVKFKDYYKVLGVPRTATDADIQKAFRGLARKYHPDVSKEKDAETRFKEINEANEILKDPAKRKEYDTLASSMREGDTIRPPPGSTYGDRGDFSSFGDFFEMFFGSNRGGPQSSPRYERRGESAEALVEVSVGEALKGSRRRVTLQLPWESRSRVLDVTIPPRSHQGTRLRIPIDDRELFIVLSLKDDASYTLDGDSVLYTLPVTPWEATLGEKVKIDISGKSVLLTIPPGTPSGKRFRLKGQGLLVPQQGGYGDLLVEIAIVTQSTMGAEERSLWERLAVVSDFYPRGKV
jgi:curved DNA-binding protein